MVEAPDDGDTRPAMPSRRRRRPRRASSRTALYQQHPPRADIEQSSSAMEKKAGVSVASPPRQ